MKRVLLTFALCLTVVASFGQKKSVSSAQSIAKGENPNFGEARNLIKGALENPETKDDAKTWYVAGLIENQQFNSENAKLYLGQQANDPVMYDALCAILPYYLKALELDQKPNAKGKIKPKFTKDIKNDLATNLKWYINAGAHYFQANDVKKAYDAFDQYIKIMNLDLFKGEPIAEKDTNFQLVTYYKGIVASQMEDHKTAIECFEALKPFDYEPTQVYQYICIEYDAMKDTANYVKALEEGFAKFPEEQYFILNLINQYTLANKTDEAIELLNKAIVQTPDNVQLYSVLGRMYEMKNNTGEAEKNFKKALEIDPQYADALAGLGRLFFNAGVTQLDEANKIDDNKLYQEEKAKANVLFEKALPFYEKALSIKPDNREFMAALSNIYYQLNMGDKLKALEARMEK